MLNHDDHFGVIFAFLIIPTGLFNLADYTNSASLAAQTADGFCEFAFGFDVKVTAFLLNTNALSEEAV
jgi:hypothetical protein